VIYQNKLISLFEQGKFVCHSISTLKRDKSFENKLNTKKFQYHWLIDSKLVGISNGKYYYLNKEDKWIEYSHDLPFTNQPKLFEDESYISFRDCFGEWGGTVYFFNKNNKKIFYTEATCANSILKRENKYFVLSHLGHMLGSAELKEISNPEKLSQVDIKKINKTVKGEALGYLDKSHASKKVFNWDYIQIFSSFKYENRTFYLVYYESETFLAEINNNTIYLVNPLFNNGFYTHQPITTSYDKTVLINLDFYMIGGEREISCIIIKDNKFIKLDWNENQTANTCL
jgi:hypothetical protein